MNRKIAAVIAGVLLAGLLPGCSAQQKAEQPDIYVICKSKDSYWDTTRWGAVDAGEEMGLNVYYEAPETEADLDVQIKMIQDAIAAGADAIVVAPLDTDALNNVLRDANLQGIPVLTIDSDVSYAGRAVCVSTQNLSAGAIAAREAAELLHAKGEVGVICHKADAQTAKERMGGFVTELDGNVVDSDGYPEISVVDVKYCEGDIERSKEGTKQLIEEHPDLKLVYATNQPGTVGACQAIEELGLADQITLVGFDYFQGADIYITHGVLDGVMTQNPYNMGYLGVRYAKKLIDGTAVPSIVDTGATYVNAANLNDADIQWLLNPIVDRPAFTD
ncbi:MAG: substrate-binding domain-containing protein [Oscillospiraceae bacterium]|nr:substrate-binding domain-containing protein [Oscillospiraceae bacterium]